MGVVDAGGEPGQALGGGGGGGAGGADAVLARELAAAVAEVHVDLGERERLHVEPVRACERACVRASVSCGCAVCVRVCLCVCARNSKTLNEGCRRGAGGEGGRQRGRLSPSAGRGREEGRLVVVGGPAAAGEEAEHRGAVEVEQERDAG